MIEDCTNEYSPYCSECSGCGDEGCCSPLMCKQSPNGNYCGTYLNDLKFGYKMHLDIMKLISDDERYKKQIDELYDKNYDLVYK